MDHIGLMAKIIGEPDREGIREIVDFKLKQPAMDKTEIEDLSIYRSIGQAVSLAAAAFVGASSRGNQIFVNNFANSGNHPNRDNSTSTEGPGPGPGSSDERGNKEKRLPHTVVEKKIERTYRYFD